MTTHLGLNFLRLMPVISSTTNFVFALDEYNFLKCWIQPEYRDRANSLLPPWFTHWTRSGLWMIVAGFGTSFVTGLINVSSRSDGLAASGARPWYLAGFAFTLAHFLYARTALRLLDDIQADRPKGNSTVSMKKWLDMHGIRTLTADIPALVCYVVGFLYTL